MLFLATVVLLVGFVTSIKDDAVAFSVPPSSCYTTSGYSTGATTIKDDAVAFFVPPSSCYTTSGYSTGATTITSFVCVLKRPQLTGSQKVGVLLTAMASGIPVGFLVFVPVSALALILFWGRGVSDHLAFLYVAAPMACLLNLLPVFLGSRLH